MLQHQFPNFIPRSEASALKGSMNRFRASWTTFSGTARPRSRQRIIRSWRISEFGALLSDLNLGFGVQVLGAVVLSVS